MTGKGKDRDQDQERPPSESSFAHLLQTNNRDLAANWAVDVGRELDNYLAQLSVAALFQDGTSSLNFAQAALLIQGSIQIYSRKVEYLYALVLQALEFIAQKKQAQQEKSSIQADGKDADIVEEDEEEFLNLDDVQEETNIDIDDEGHEASALTPAAKPPASLLVLEGEAIDIGGDGGELAAYQIATSSLHRDFLLLDPCDADAVDKYLNVNKGADNGTPNHLSSSARRRTPRTPKNGLSTPGKRAGSVQKSVVSKGPQSAIKHPEFNEVGCSQGASDIWDRTAARTYEAHCGQDMGNDKNHDFCSPYKGFDEDSFGGHASIEDDFEDDEDDPWQPLNPHEPGDLPVKPYRRGLLSKKQKVRDADQVATVLEFPLAKRFSTICPEFTKVSETGDCNGKQTSHSPPIYEKLRSSMTLNQSNSFDGPGSPDDDDPGIEAEHDFEDLDIFDDYLGESNNSIAEAENPMLPQEHYDDVNLSGNDGLSFQEKDFDTGASFEDLCRAHLDALLRNIAESQKQTELASRVSTWKQKIEKNLEEQDSRPPFDIHVYGERVLDAFSLSSNEELENGSGVRMSFAEIVGGQERHEVARTFAALLQLVNNGNVALEKGISGGQPFCFTAEKPFFVRLLSSSRRHEEMLKYRAPSVSTPPAKKVSKKSKNKSPLDRQTGIRITENKDANSRFSDVDSCSKLFISKGKDVGKQRVGSALRSGTNYERNHSPDVGRRTPGSASRFTPENKRRRRLQSVRPIEIQVAR